MIDAAIIGLGRWGKSLVNEVQGSTQYPGGVALRFARIKRYRSDKTADQADTIGTVQELYRRMTGIEL